MAVAGVNHVQRLGSVERDRIGRRAGAGHELDQLADVVQGEGVSVAPTPCPPDACATVSPLPKTGDRLELTFLHRWKKVRGGSPQSEEDPGRTAGWRLHQVIGWPYHDRCGLPGETRTPDPRKDVRELVGAGADDVVQMPETGVRWLHQGYMETGKEKRVRA